MNQPLAGEGKPSPQESIFLQSLKQSTAAAHRALEGLPISVAITDPGVTMAGYTNYLLRMFPVVQDVEQNIFPTLGEIIPDLEQRRKLPFLRQDLEFLQATIPGMQVEPLSDGNSPMSRPFALGILYVLEGSTLGGRFIGNNIQKNLGFNAGAGGRYFAGYRENTGLLWKDFLKYLVDFEKTENAADEIISGANFAFRKIYNYLKG
jgi:heme oxygenase